MTSTKIPWSLLAIAAVVLCQLVQATQTPPSCRPWARLLALQMKVTIAPLMFVGAVLAQGPWCHQTVSADWSRPTLLVAAWQDIQTQWNTTFLDSVLQPNSSTFHQLSYMRISPSGDNVNHWNKVHERVDTAHKERISTAEELRRVRRSLTGEDKQNVPPADVLQVWDMSKVKAGLHSQVHQACHRKPRDIHIFAAPPNAGSFSWHTDKIDALLCMISGSKRVRVAGQTPHSDVQIDAVMNPGDCVYFPAYFYHNLVSVTSSVLLSVGFTVRNRPWWNHVLTQKRQIPAFTQDMRGILVFVHLHTEFIKGILIPSKDVWTKLSYKSFKHVECHVKTSLSHNQVLQPFDDQEMFRKYMNSNTVKILQINDVENLNRITQKVFHGPIGLNKTFSRTIESFSIIYIGSPKNASSSICQAWATVHDTLILTLHGSGNVSLINGASQHCGVNQEETCDDTMENGLDVGSAVYIPAGAQWHLSPGTKNIVLLRIQFLGAEGHLSKNSR